MSCMTATWWSSVSTPERNGAVPYGSRFSESSALGVSKSITQAEVRTPTCPPSIGHTEDLATRLKQGEFQKMNYAVVLEVKLVGLVSTRECKC